MEFETYEDVIDSYNSGVGVEAGESLTDYIKRNNIKIKEIEMDPIGDLEKILREGKQHPWKKKVSNQCNLHQATWTSESKKLSKNLLNKKVEDQDLLEEIKEFYQMEMTGSGGASNRDNVSLAELRTW